MSVLANQFGSLQLSSDGYVSNLHIRDEVRGQGHGTALMQEAIAQHSGSLTLNARPDLHPFYEKLGFKATGDTDLGQPRMRREAG